MGIQRVTFSLYRDSNKVSSILRKSFLPEGIGRNLTKQLKNYYLNKYFTLT